MSPTGSTRSTPPGAGSRSRSGSPRKEAFADVVEDWADAHGGPPGLHDVRRPPRGGLLPLEDHRALRRPARARRGPERHAARRLAVDAVLVPRDDEAVQLHGQEARPPGPGDPAQRPLPRRLPVREDAALVLPPVRGARRGDEAARRGRRQVRHGHEPYDLLVRASTTRSSCRRSSARSRPTSCT